MSQLATSPSDQEKSTAPIAVAPLEAGRLLSLSLSRVYQLMRAGEIASYEDGHARRIPMAEIHAHVARRLANTKGWRQLRKNRK